MSESKDSPFAEWKLEGRVALVVGGARHLGHDIASVLASAGASIVVTSRDSGAAGRAADHFASQYGVDALGLAVDVRSPESIESATRAVRDRHGRLDVLVNNAGGGSGGSIGDFFTRPAEDIRRMIETNLTGTMLCSQSFGRLIAEGGSGSIINVGSIAALVGRDRRMYEDGGVEQQPVDYAAAKAGVVGFTRDLAAYLAPTGVRANAISPGGFGPRELPPAFVAEYARRTPLGRMGQDGVDLKGAALFLASDASAYVTGHNLVVDGGFSSWR